MNPLILIGLGDFGELCVRYTTELLEESNLTDIIIKEPTTDDELKEAIPCPNQKKWMVVKSLREKRTMFQFEADNYESVNTVRNNYSDLNEHRVELYHELKRAYNSVNEVGRSGTPTIILFSSTYDQNSSVYNTLILELLDQLSQSFPFSLFNFLLLPEMIDQDLRVEVDRVRRGEYSNQEVINALYEHLLSGLIEYKKLLKGECKLYVRQAGSKSISIEDINQGQVGDCYYLAALGAIALKKPEHVQNMIIEHGDDTYTVRFFSKEEDPLYVTVDSKIWVGPDNAPLYSGNRNSSGTFELWPVILEKAWAKLNGRSYDQIQGDKTPEHALPYDIALTGNAHTYVSIDGFENDAEFLKELESIFTKKNLPVCFGSRGDAPGNDVVPTHAYTLHKLNKRTLTLYNPWGRQHLEEVDVEFVRTNFEGFYYYTLKEFGDTLKEYRETKMADPYRSVCSISEIEYLARDFSFNNYFCLIDGYNCKDNFIGKIEDVVPAVAEFNSLLCTGKVNLPDSEIHTQAYNKSNAFWLAFGLGALVYPETKVIQMLISKALSGDFELLAEKLHSEPDIQAAASEVKGFYNLGIRTTDQQAFPVLNDADKLLTVEQEHGKEIFIPFKSNFDANVADSSAEDIISNVSVKQKEYENNDYNQSVLSALSVRKNTLEQEYVKTIDIKLLEHLDNPQKGLNYAIAFNKLLVEDSDTIGKTGIASVDDNSLVSLRRKLIAFYREKFQQSKKDEVEFDETGCLDVDYRKMVKEEENASYFKALLGLHDGLRKNEAETITKKKEISDQIERKRKYVRNYFVILPIVLLVIVVSVNLGFNPLKIDFSNLSRIKPLFQITGLFFLIYYIVMVIRYFIRIYRPLRDLRIELIDLETNKVNLVQQIYSKTNEYYKADFKHHVFEYLNAIYSSLENKLRAKITSLEGFKSELLALRDKLAEESKQLAFIDNKFRSNVLSDSDVENLYNKISQGSNYKLYFKGGCIRGEHYQSYVTNGDSIVSVTDQGRLHYQEMFRSVRKKTILEAMIDNGKDFSESLATLGLISLPFLRLDETSGSEEGTRTLITYYCTDPIKVEIESSIKDKSSALNWTEIHPTTDKNTVSELQMRTVINLEAVKFLKMTLRNLFALQDPEDKILLTSSDAKYDSFTTDFIHKVYPRWNYLTNLIGKSIILKVIQKEKGHYLYHKQRLGENYTEIAATLDKKYGLTSEIEYDIDELFKNNIEEAISLIRSYKCTEPCEELSALSELRIRLGLEDE